MILWTQSAMANVIYDVAVGYAGGGHTAQYSFTMEFAAPPPNGSAGDLVNPTGDFTNERLILDGVELTLFEDRPVQALNYFGGPVLSFTSADTFANATFDRGCISQGAPLSPTVCLVGSLQILQFVSISVVERLAEPAAPAPIAPTLALLGIGLAALRLGRGRDTAL